MVRDRKRATVLITDAHEDPERELRRRELRYVAMMALRAVCLVIAAIIASVRAPYWGVWVGLCLVAMVLLPWFAVLLANDRPAKKRVQPVPAAVPAPVAATDGPAALPSHRVIDADL